MENYEPLSLVGEGSFGRVYKAKKRSTNEIVALKVIRKYGRTARELLSLRSECEIQRQLRHPNIILMHESFENDAEIVVVTEFAKRGLHEVLNEEGYFGEQKAQSVVCDLVAALHYLHSHRVLHRDLKPQNVLISEDGVAKLCDFGFARSMSRGTHVLTSIKGTPLYMAPELIEESPYDHNADLWSLGCIVYEMLVGTPPFTTNSIVHLVRMIRHENIKWPDFLSATCQDFLKGLLQKKPKQRLTWPNLLSHPFLKGNVSIATDESTASGPLTCELTSSQALAKEQQRLDLAMKHGAQMELMRQAVKNMVLEENAMGQLVRIRPTYSLNDGNVIRAKNVFTAKSLGDNAAAGNQKKERSFQQADNIEKPGLMSSKTTWAQEGETSVQNHMDVDNGNIVGEGIGVRIAFDISGTEMRAREIINDMGKYGRPHLSSAASALDSCHNDTLRSETPVEIEEWLAFLQTSMEEVMEGDVESVSEKTFVSMVIAALSNHGASCRVTEYVACFLSLPFVIESVTHSEAVHIRKVYLEVNVVASLMYALNLLTTRPGCHVSGDSYDNVIDTMELNADQLVALECVLLLVTHLVYSDTAFISQFCDAVALLRLCPRLHALLFLSKRKFRIVNDLVAILMQILKEMPENAGLVEEIFLAVGSRGSKLQSLLTFCGRTKVTACIHSLLISSNPSLQMRTCTLISLLARFCSNALEIMWTKQLTDALEKLQDGSSPCVSSAATRAVQEMKKLPFYTHESME